MLSLETLALEIYNVACYVCRHMLSGSQDMDWIVPFTGHVQFRNCDIGVKW